MAYRVFVRNWWKDNFDGTWPNNLEPDSAAKERFLGTFSTEEAARQRCAIYNDPHEAGRYSRKAEYEEAR